MPELMTKQDAIEYLLYMKHDVQAKSPMDIALDTAIEALKQPTFEPEVRHGRLDEDKPLTNGDRIRQMTDEELVEFLMNADANVCDFCDMKYPENCLSHSCEGEDCKTGILKWLKQEVSEDAGSKTN